MSPTAITQATSIRPSAVVRRQTPRQWMQEHLVAINVLTLALLAMLCVSYILQVTDTVTKGYVLRDLEVEIHQLTLSNEQMEIVTRQSQSLEHVAKSVKMLGVVDAEQPIYIQSGEPSYVLAE